jgi:hypothetical protein
MKKGIDTGIKKSHYTTLTLDQKARLFNLNGTYFRLG